MQESFLLAQATRGSDTAATPKAANSVLDLFKGVFDYGQRFIVTMAILLGSYIIGKIIAGRVIRHIQKSRGDVLYQDLENLIHRSIVYGAMFTGFAVCLEFIFNIDFLQIVGFFGLGIGFAFRDLLANLIGGVVVILQNRFHVGDFICIGGSIKGKVMEIQTRATILKAIDGTEIIVPNADLLKKTVQSYTAHHVRRIGIPISVHYNTNIELATRLIENIMKKKPHILKKPKAKVIAKGFGDSAIELEARFNIDPQEHGKSWIEIKSEIIEEVQQAFAENGITIPFPQRVIHQSSDRDGLDWKEKGDKKLLSKTKKAKSKKKSNISLKEIKEVKTEVSETKKEMTRQPDQPQQAPLSEEAVGPISLSQPESGLQPPFSTTAES
jgi:small conductance mechanosensitive channel